MAHEALVLQILRRSPPVFCLWYLRSKRFISFVLLFILYFIIVSGTTAQ